jgi:hypothetical protein
MSIQAIVWAIEQAPDVPPNLVGLLIGLANHADADGRASYPAIDRLAFYARKKRRATQYDIEKLIKIGLVRRGDQRHVLHIDPRYRPVVYDLATERKRDPYLPRHSRNDIDVEPVDNPDSRGAVRCTPDRSRDALRRNQGCTVVHPGAHHSAPEPSLKPSENQTPLPPAATIGDHRAPRGRDEGGGIDSQRETREHPKPEAASMVDRFIADIPTGWINASGRARLTVAVGDALTRGCTRHQILDTFNQALPPGDVRDLAGLMSARMAKLEVPRQAAPKPPWCGSCDQQTRMGWDEDDERAYRRPACHPLVNTEEGQRSLLGGLEAAS